MRSQYQTRRARFKQMLYFGVIKKVGVQNARELALFVQYSEKFGGTLRRSPVIIASEAHTRGNSARFFRQNGTLHKVGRNRVRRQCVLPRFHCRRRLPGDRYEAYQARPAAEGGACGDYSRARFFSRIYGRVSEVTLMHGRKKPLRKLYIRRFKQKSGRLCRSGNLSRLRSFGVFPRFSAAFKKSRRYAQRRGYDFSRVIFCKIAEQRRFKRAHAHGYIRTERACARSF